MNKNIIHYEDAVLLEKINHHDYHDDDEIFLEAKSRFFQNNFNRDYPLWRKINSSLRSDEGTGYSNAEFIVTLINSLKDLGIDFEYMYKTSSMPRKKLFNNGTYLPEYNFGSCRPRVVYIFPEARFGYRNCRVDFAIYYKDGCRTIRWVWEIQTKDHLSDQVFENDCEKMQHIFLQKWTPMWFTSRQVFHDKEGKFLKPFLDLFATRYEAETENFQDVNRTSMF